MDESETQDDKWTSGGSSEPSAELLHGAIAHVEQLIRRLDYAPDRLTVEEVEEVEAPESDPPRRIGKKSAARAAADPPPEPAPAAPAAPAGAQAEALRITLTAHDEANRLLSEGAAMRSAAAAEGQRILADAQRLAAELRVEAEAEAERHRAEAIAAAAQMRSEAQAAMRAAIADATSAANEVHTAAQADAHRIRTEAEAWAAEQRETAEAMVNQALEQAERDADEIRALAAEEGRREAERRVATEVDAAVVEARSRVETAESRARDTLAGATRQVQFAGERIAALLGVAGATVEVLEQVAGELHTLSAEPEESSPAAEQPEEPAAADDAVEAVEAASPGDEPSGIEASEASEAEASGEATEAAAPAAEAPASGADGAPQLPGEDPVADAAAEPTAEAEEPADEQPADEQPADEQPADEQDDTVGLDDLLGGERETASASASAGGEHGQRGKAGRPLGSLFRGEKRD